VQSGAARILALDRHLNVLETIAHELFNDLHSLHVIGDMLLIVWPRAGALVRRDLNTSETVAHIRFDPRAWVCDALCLPVCFSKRPPVRSIVAIRADFPAIRAPRTGRDSPAPKRSDVPRLFRSARPAWGATYYLKSASGQRLGFDPRAPHGARHMDG
jgi:hypothetical protein